MEMMRKTLRITTAHDYPNRPVRFIVPFVPGAGTDITARGIKPAIAMPLANVRGAKINYEVIGTHVRADRARARWPARP
jgi:tripartite-type tricarboxylate transporter receptor subunit TctC